MKRETSPALACSIGLAQSIDQQIRKLLEGEESGLINFLPIEGGKKLRAKLVLCGAAIAQGKSLCPEIQALSPTLLQAAAIPELVHLVSLLHDDIIDRAELRRGQASLHLQLEKQGGNGKYRSANAANYLLCYALESIGSEISQALSNSHTVTAQIPQEEAEQQQVYRQLAGHFHSSQLLSKLSLGASLELAERYNANITLRRYMQITRWKTAELFAQALWYGAQLGLHLNSQKSISLVPTKAEKRLLQGLYQFGISLGTVFQLSDDIFDFSLSSSQRGKPVGHDLLRGEATLPSIYILQRGPRALRSELKQALKQRDSSLLQALIPKIAASPALSFSISYRDRLIDRALTQLSTTESAYPIEQKEGSSQNAEQLGYSSLRQMCESLRSQDF